LVKNIIFSLYPNHKGDACTSVYPFIFSLHHSMMAETCRSECNK